MGHKHTFNVRGLYQCLLYHFNVKDNLYGYRPEYDSVLKDLKGPLNVLKEAKSRIKEDRYYNWGRTTNYVDLDDSMKDIINEIKQMPNDIDGLEIYINLYKGVI